MLQSSSAYIYFTPESTIEAVESKSKISNLDQSAAQQVIGAFKTFSSSNELIFSPETQLYRQIDNILTIGNFLKDKTQYCFVEQDIFDGGYINRSYDLDLYGPNVFVDFPQTSAPCKTISKKLVPIASRRKQAVITLFEDERVRLMLGKNATYQEIFDNMGAPTKRQLWNTLHNTGNTDFYNIDSKTDRTLQSLTPIAQELGFTFALGRPSGPKK